MAAAFKLLFILAHPSCCKFTFHVRSLDSTAPVRSQVASSATRWYPLFHPPLSSHLHLGFRFYRIGTHHRFRIEMKLVFTRWPWYVFRFFRFYSFHLFLNFHLFLILILLLSFVVILYFLHSLYLLVSFLSCVNSSPFFLFQFSSSLFLFLFCLFVFRSISKNNHVRNRIISWLETRAE